ncbi:hypothetical protein HK104_008601 [Borealophlyctis nickersoniae]|nr:hypothetical protein HK104_008601 [Borealophlyctis nickersoniae]
MDALMNAVDNAIQWIVLTTPELGLYLVRYTYPDPLDKLFFEALRGLTLDMALPGAKARFAMRFARCMENGTQAGVARGSGVTEQEGSSKGPVNKVLRRTSWLARMTREWWTAVRSSFAGGDGLSQVVALAGETDGEGLRGLRSGGLEYIDGGGSVMPNFFKLGHGESAQPSSDSIENRPSTPPPPLPIVPPPPAWVEGGRGSPFSRLTAYIRRYLRRLMILTVITLASMIPIFGRLAWPAATVWYLALAIGWRNAAMVCAAGIVSPPWWRFVRGPLLKNIVRFRAFERELVEPYLCRSVLTSAQVMVGVTSIAFCSLNLCIINVENIQRRAWFHKHEPLIAGFALPFHLALLIPYLGPIVFGIAQASSARLCVEIFDEADVALARANNISRKPSTPSSPSSPTNGLAPSPARAPPRPRSMWEAGGSLFGTVVGSPVAERQLGDGIGGATERRLSGDHLDRLTARARASWAG